jgi:hypothetical protein
MLRCSRSPLCHAPADSADGAAPKVGFTAKRLMRIAAQTGAKRYLEIGVHAGKTFHALDFPEMDAVDPYFVFDPLDHARDGRRYFPVTSDQFFASPPDAKPYDLIFLDGLHTFEQTFRDFCATQALAHAGTVWLIDDTGPNDIFSAIPDQDLALELRAAHGSDSPGWNGDVFKTVFALHDFFPNFDYRTITNNGRPQTMVIRHPRTGFAPRWNNLESISRAGYVEYTRNRDLMQEAVMDAAMAWLVAANLPQG